MTEQPSVIFLSTWGASLLVPYLTAFENQGIKVLCIVFDGERSEKSKGIHRDRTAGFFHNQSMFDVEKMQVPGYFVNNHNGEQCIELVRDLGCEILVNAGIRRILSAEILASADIGVVNSHPGLMPKYRGCSCLEWSIFNDDAVGSTCHFMNEAIDAGPIVFQEEMKVQPNEVYESVRARIIEHAAEVAASGVRRIIDEGLRPDCLPKVSTDSYFDVMSQDQFEQVRQKMVAGKYQCAGPPSKQNLP